MTEHTTRASAIGSLAPLVAALLAWLLAGERLGDAMRLPREGGWLRAVTLALARAPELFALLGSIALASIAIAVLALGGSPRARRLAGWLGALLFLATGAAVLALLPPPLEPEGWSRASEWMAFAQPRMIFALGVLAMCSHTIALGLARAIATVREGGGRGLASEPALAAMVAWIALAVSLRWMWFSLDEPYSGTGSDVCDAVLLGAIALGVGQTIMRVWRARRRG